jgi:hypothetical protein
MDGPFPSPNRLGRQRCSKFYPQWAYRVCVGECQLHSQVSDQIARMTGEPNHTVSLIQDASASSNGFRQCLKSRCDIGGFVPIRQIAEHPPRAGVSLATGSRRGTKGCRPAPLQELPHNCGGAGRTPTFFKGGQEAADLAEKADDRQVKVGAEPAVPLYWPTERLSPSYSVARREAGWPCVVMRAPVG